MPQLLAEALLPLWIDRAAGMGVYVARLTEPWVTHAAAQEWLRVAHLIRQALAL
jgi:hypothetical protein